MKDDNICELIQAGQPEKAFRLLYKEYPKVRSMIRKSGGSTSDAADIFQEALLVVYRKFSSGNISVHTSVNAYLFGVCRYLWYKSQRNRLQMQADTDQVIDDNDAEQWLHEDQKVHLAEKVLTMLGNKCRELLLGFYTSGQSMEALARKFGYASVNTAKTRKYKCLESARTKFREMYQQSQKK